MTLCEYYIPGLKSIRKNLHTSMRNRERVSKNHRQRPRDRIHHILTFVILVFRWAPKFTLTIAKQNANNTK